MLTLKKIAMLTAPALVIGGAVLLASSEAEAQPYEVHIAELRHACTMGDAYACQEWRWAVRQPRHVYVAPAPRVYHRRYRPAYQPRRVVHRRHVAPAPRSYRRHVTPAPRYHQRRGPAVRHAPRHRPAVHRAPPRQGGGNRAHRGGGGRAGRGRRGHI